MIYSLKKKKYRAGMTLIELMVVLAIFAVVSSIVIFNYGNFKSTASLQNLAEDIALSIRSAQGYAIGVKSVGSAGEFPGYGIHFGPTSTTDTKGPKTFILFADIPSDTNDISTADKQYNFNPTTPCNAEHLSYGDECLQTTTIATSDQIIAICKGTDDSGCGISNPNPTVYDPGASVDIVFVRPNQDAHFCYKPTQNVDGCDAGVSSVRIKIQSIDGAQKIISVWNTGQVRIE